MDYKKVLLRFGAVALLTAIILSISGWIFSVVRNSSVAWGTGIALLLAAAYFYATKKFNPGKEQFFEYFPILVLTAGLMALIAVLWPALPLSFAVEVTLPGLALAFGSVFLATAITSKYVTK